MAASSNTTVENVKTLQAPFMLDFDGRVYFPSLRKNGLLEEEYVELLVGVNSAQYYRDIADRMGITAVIEGVEFEDGSH